MTRTARTPAEATHDVVINPDNRGARIVPRQPSASATRDEKPQGLLLAVPSGSAAVASQELVDAAEAYVRKIEALELSRTALAASPAELALALAETIMPALRLVEAAASLRRVLAAGRQLTVDEEQRIHAVAAPAQPAAAAPVVNVDLGPLVDAIRELANQPPPVVNVEVPPAEPRPKTVEIRRDQLGRVDGAVVKEIP